MTRTCTVCSHVDVEEINKRLVSGESYRDIARQYALSKDSLSRHKDNHIPEALLKANDVQEVSSADSLLKQLKEIRDKAYSLLDKAEVAGSTKVYGPPSAYLKEIREQIKLMAEIEGKIPSQPQINIINNPEWVEIRTKILYALDPYPEAKAAIVHALHG